MQYTLVDSDVIYSQSTRLCELFFSL